MVTSAWLALGVATPAEAAEVLHFVARVVRVELLGVEPAIVVDHDPRFAVAVQITEVSEDVDPFPFAVGETRVFAVHSPTHLFLGAQPVGTSFAFDVTTDGGPVPRYSNLRAHPAAPNAAPAPVEPRVVSAADIAAAIRTPDTTCRVDADCAVALVHLDGPYTCCVGCGTSTAGAASWVEHVMAVCAGVDADRGAVPEPGHLADCTPLACPQGRTSAGCVAGTCVLAP